MKQFKIICLETGDTKIEITGHSYANENKAAKLVVDYTNSGVSDWLKWLDFKLADESESKIYFTTAAIIEIFLPSSLTTSGNMIVKPWASKADEVGGADLVAMFKERIIENEPNFKALENSAVEHPDIFAQIGGDMLRLQNEKLDKTVIDPARWNDIVFELTPTRIGANNKPDYDYTNIGFLFPQNQTSEIIYLTVQLPHTWKVGTTIFPHVHVVQSSNQQAVFKMEYKWYNIGGAIPTDWTIYTMDSYAIPYASGSIPQIVKGASGIVGTGKDISSILKIKLYRQDNNYIGDILADQFDIHIQIDGFGSQEQYIKL